MNLKIKRIYETPESSDGFRILVDRIWPRGVSKQEAQISLWLKTIAPSTELRKWFDHSPSRWNEFQQRYLEELKEKDEELQIIQEHLNTNRNVTLLYSAKDTKHNQANALLKYFKSLEE